VQAQEALVIQKSQIESSIKDRELTLEISKSDFEKYVEGDWPQARTNAVSAITLAAEDLARAKDTLNWTEVLAKKDYATKSQLQADRLDLDKKQIALDQSQVALSLLEKYTYPKQRRLLEATVESNTKELERLKQRSASQVAQSEADLTSRKRTLALQQERLDDLKKQMAATKINAPSDGLVVYSLGGGGSYSSTLIEEGASIRFRQEIIKLPNINQMVIEIRVHEAHVTKIHEGLPAYVTIDSMPDMRLKGHVHKVAVLPDSSSRYYNPTLKVYVTEVLIDDPLPAELKPGVSGRAEVVITNLVNVLAVPLQAVTSIKGEQVCFVGRNHDKKPVEVGHYNDKFIEIRSGIKESDEILMAPLLMEADEIDLSGSIVDSGEYEADRKGITKKGKTSRKAGGKGGAGAKPAVAKPPTPLQTLQQPLKELRRATEPLEGAQAAPKEPARPAASATGPPAARALETAVPASKKSGQPP
jgi:HlyD family secretion protein